MENEKKSGDKYSKLAGNTLIFAISSFSSKLLTLIVQPFLTYAMAEISDLGLSKILSQYANLLIPFVSMGMSNAIIRFGLDKGNSEKQVFHWRLRTNWVHRVRRQLMSSVYVVNKKSARSMITMMAGAVSNCIMNYFFIKWWGPVGATYASFLGLALVFTLRAIDAHRMIGMQVHPGRVLVNAAALVIEAFVLLAETPLYGLWTGIITALIIQKLICAGIMGSEKRSICFHRSLLIPFSST